MNALYAVEWTEYERGWGCRPDGHSVHRNLNEAQRFITVYLNNLPKEIPDEYSSPGEPKIMEVSESLQRYVNLYGDVWLSQNSTEAVKAYDAAPLFESIR